MNNLTPQEKKVLKTLLYFNIFSYPLKEKELSKFTSIKPIMLRKTLFNLVKKKLIFYNNGYYGIYPEKDQVSYRIRGEKKARKAFKIARIMSLIISKFPYVEGVYLSGSISKNFLSPNEKEADVDYFIITSPGRLWTAKAFLTGFKKIFLLNSKKYFCINYFMNVDALEIEEKNLFTATEFITLRPMYDRQCHMKLVNSNKWILNYFPSYQTNDTHVKDLKKLFLTKWIEKMLNGKLGDKLEKWFQKKFKDRQKKKYKKLLSKEDYHLAFKGNDKVSKHHPNNYQKKIILKLNEKINAFNKKYSVDITLEPLIHE